MEITKTVIFVKCRVFLPQFSTVPTNTA